MIKLRHKNKFISLNLKLTLAIMIGVILAVGMYFACQGFTTLVVNKIYLSDEYVKDVADSQYASLEQYIKDDNVKGTDTKKLNAWIQDEKYSYLYVYDNKKTAFEAGWWVDSDSNSGESVSAGTEAAANTDSDVRIDEDKFDADEKNRIVQFADAKYYVYLDSYKEMGFYNIMDLVTIIFCFSTLLATLLIYNKRVLNRLINMSEEVKKVSDGDMDSAINMGKNDELGMLAKGVNAMRDSVIEKLQNEQKAWEANTQLITAMSHDIRTPLTAMIGYLDIIEGKKYNTPEELDKYVSSCRDKAFQLKDLSDKLFQYFLVFGNEENESSLECVNAGILIQQLMAEHAMDITNYGFKINFNYTVPEVFIMADISRMQRLFDNIFSNVSKYADKQFIVDITAYADEHDVVAEVSNHVLESSRKIESNRIGIKTCEKICSDLKGSFEINETKKVFDVVVRLPIVENPPEQSGEAEPEGE